MFGRLFFDFFRKIKEQAAKQNIFLFTGLLMAL
jgi:hypothetical protein